MSRHKCTLLRPKIEYYNVVKDTRINYRWRLADDTPYIAFIIIHCAHVHFQRGAHDMSTSRRNRDRTYGDVT